MNENDTTYFNNLKSFLINYNIYNNNHIKGETYDFDIFLKQLLLLGYGFVINKSVKYEGKTSKYRLKLEKGKIPIRFMSCPFIIKNHIYYECINGPQKKPRENHLKLHTHLYIKMQSSQTGMVGQPSFNVGSGLQSNIQNQVSGQHNVLVPQVPLNQNPVGVGSVSQPPVPPSNQNQSASGHQFNTASLCRFGQETVQEIVSRTHEVFQILKVLMPPNGTPTGANMSNERRIKMQDQLRNIKLLFKRLRIIYEKCNDSCQLQGMEYMHMEGLIPLQEEWDMKSEERKTSETYRVASDEMKEVAEQLSNKNKHLKEIIDHLRRIIWEINTMLAMRRS